MNRLAVVIGATLVFGGEAQPAATGDVARLCASKQDLVHIVPKVFDDDPPDTPTSSTYEASGPNQAPGRLTLDRKVDLNGDGAPELVFSDPSQITNDARFLDWYVDCGAGNYYPLFGEYAADYEVGKAAAKGWKPVYFFNNISPEKPSFSVVAKDTYRFDGAHYTRVKSEKVKRRIF